MSSVSHNSIWHAVQYTATNESHFTGRLFALWWNLTVWRKYNKTMHRHWQTTCVPNLSFLRCFIFALYMTHTHTHASNVYHSQCFIFLPRAKFVWPFFQMLLCTSSHYCALDLFLTSNQTPNMSHLCFKIGPARTFSSRVKGQWGKNRQTEDRQSAIHIVAFHRGGCIMPSTHLWFNITHKKL